MIPMKQTTKTFWEKTLAGLVIGIGAILPGVSGGILAVSMGLYRRMLDAIYNFFRAPMANFLFLLPIGIGGVVGLLAAGQVLGVLLSHFRLPILYLFMGLVLGGAPSLWKEGIKESGFKPKYLIATLIGALIILALSLIKNISGGLDLPLNGYTAALCGGIIAVGTVIPGISTSFLLIYLGLFDEMLAALNAFNIPILACTGAGVVVVALLLIRSVRTAFIRYPHAVYFAVLGFLCSSVALIFPGLPTGINWLICPLLLIGGYFATFAIEKAMCKS